MNRKALTTAFAAVAALLAMACKDALDIGSFSVTGTWAGTAKKQVSGTDSATYTFRMELEQDQRSIDGTAVVKAGTDSVIADVDGVWNYPRVSLQFKAPEFATLQFNSTFTPEANRDTLAGPLVGSGLDGVTLKLVRQTQ
ncbi:MAG TPA: hypothetical protein VF092_15120 [Longimicrobium sp.]